MCVGVCYSRAGPECWLRVHGVLLSHSSCFWSWPYGAAHCTGAAVCVLARSRGPQWSGGCHVLLQQFESMWPWCGLVCCGLQPCNQQQRSAPASPFHWRAAAVDRAQLVVSLLVGRCYGGLPVAVVGAWFGLLQWYEDSVTVLCMRVRCSWFSGVEVPLTQLVSGWLQLFSYGTRFGTLHALLFVYSLDV